MVPNCSLTRFLFLTKSLAFITLLTSCVQSNEGTRTLSIFGEDETAKKVSPSHQLNCSVNIGICNKVCNETKHLPWSSTFCDPESGSCICDCRDSIPKECQKTPFTPCFQNCVRKNPNPDVYLYEGGNCPEPQTNGTIDHQCVCECTVRDDYEETNDIF